MVMPFRLTNAPYTSQALINYILWDLWNTKAYIYLDDICIFSSSIEDHVLNLMLNKQLFVNAKMYKFQESRMSFLGYIISEKDGDGNLCSTSPPPTTYRDSSGLIIFIEHFKGGTSLATHSCPNLCFSVVSPHKYCLLMLQEQFCLSSLPVIICMNNSLGRFDARTRVLGHAYLRGSVKIKEISSCGFLYSKFSTADTN